MFMTLPRKEFLDTISLARDVFGDDVFRLPSTAEGKPGKLSKPLYDAEIVSLFRLLDRADNIRAHAPEIKVAVMNLALPDAPTYELMVGRGNTALTIKERITKVQDVIQGILNNGES